MWFHDKDFLLWFVKLILFVEKSRKNVIKSVVARLFHVYMILAYLDYLVLCFAGKKASQWKITTAYIFSFSSSFATWLVLRKKRKSLMNLLRNLQTMSISVESNWKFNFSFCVICTMPFLYAVLYSITTGIERFARQFTFYTYHKYITDKNIRCTVIFLKGFLLTFLYPAFTNLVTLTFCRSCHQCCSRLKNLSDKIQKCPLKNFTYVSQIEILSLNTRNVNLLNEIQRVFSLPLLLLCIGGFSTSCSIIGSFVLYEIKDISVLMGADSVYATLFSTVPLITIIWIAGRVPIESKKFRDAFCKKMEHRVLLGLDSEGGKLERWMYDLPDFVLTAGDVFRFRRSLILTFVGTMITYTFLLVNTNNY